MMGCASDGRTSRIGANSARAAVTLSATRDIAASRAAEATVEAAWPCDARARGGGGTADGGSIVDGPGALHRRSTRLKKTARWATSGRQSTPAAYLLTRRVGDAASVRASRKCASTAGPGTRGSSTKSRTAATKSSSSGNAAMPTGANGGAASFRASGKCASTARPSTRGSSTKSRTAASNRGGGRTFYA
jgi:hypothetical protein